VCELLGLNFNRQINPVFSFIGLMSESHFHSDGWGLAYYPDKSSTAAVFKEPVAGCDSKLAAFIANYQEMKSKIFLSHIRRASAGSLQHSNCHPFTRYFRGGEWVFAHNGTLHGYPSTRKGMAYLPLGKTDSEYVFCKLLSEMKKRKIYSTKTSRCLSRNKMIGLQDLLIEINDFGDGSLNCIFSDSQYLFCYRDFQGARPLYYLKREYPFDTTRLRDNDLEVNLNLLKNDSDCGYVVASDNLTDENWTSFQPGQLMVFKNGKVVANLR